MYLSKRAFGFAWGFFCGLALLSVTYLVLILDTQGATIEKLSIILKGYSVSWAGGLFGFLYGFIIGFGFGFCFALIYNFVINVIKKINLK